MLQIREVAKKTMLIADHNPHINRDLIQSKGLFNGLSQQRLNEDEEAAVEEALGDVPSLFSDAVLYKAVQPQSPKTSSHKVMLKESRQFLLESRSKTMNLHRHTRSDGTYIQI